MDFPSAVDSHLANAADSKNLVFNQIVHEHLDGIYHFSRFMLSDAEEAEDIVQKTFVSLYQNLPKLDQGRPLKPWLYKVARNHCLDYLKKKKALNFSAIEDQISEIPENSPTLEDQLDSAVFLDHVKDIVQTLPPQIRAVLLLRYFEDLAFEQIAEILSEPLNTVKSNFYRGKAKIYNILKDIYA